jgi:hypothetical protein
MLDAPNCDITFTKAQDSETELYVFEKYAKT